MATSFTSDYAVPAGLPPPSDDDLEVEVPKSTNIELIQARDGTAGALWTGYMTDCNCVATFNPKTKHRSLCHLLGGDYKGLAKKLAGFDFVDADTLVIFSNGSSSSRDNFVRWQREAFTAIQMEFYSKQKRAGKPIIFYTEPLADGDTSGIADGTFRMEPDGHYGRINQKLERHEEQGQAQEETTSRDISGAGIPGGRETTSRGLSGGDPWGSHGKQRGGPSKGGFWRMMLCCCMLSGHHGGGAQGSKATKKGEKKKGGILRRMICCCSK